MSHKFSHRVASLFLALAIAFAGVTPALAAPPLNDNFADAEAILSLPFSATIDISDATNELDEPHPCWFMERSIWYSFSPSQTMVVSASAQGSSVSNNVNVYRSTGSGINGLEFLTCADFESSRAFVAEAGQLYYLQASSLSGDVGNIQVNLEAVPPPANDDFASADSISLPSIVNFDNTGATFESGEPSPSCAFTSPPHRTIWFTFTSSQTGSVSVSVFNNNFSPFWAVYTGTGFNDLTEVDCRSGGTLTFTAATGQTYHIQVGGLFEEGGTGTLQVQTTPPPEASFFFFPSSPSSFDNVTFCDNSFDPGEVGFESFTWDFGDGATSTDNCANHQYAADGDYNVQHSVTTFDGRTSFTSQVVQVLTHDVSITKVSAPRSASVGQTRTINVYIRNTRYPETVRIELYKGVPGGGFELIGVSTQFVPVRKGNRTSQFTFNYTFSPQDAQTGKVTFKAVVIIENANDAFTADNEAISTPPTVVKR